MNQNFLWGDSQTRKRCHTIGWDMTTKAKELGGLNIKKKLKKKKKKRERAMNTAMLINQAWRLWMNLD